MLDTVQDVLMWLMSVVLDRPWNGGEAFRGVFPFALGAVASWIALRWKEVVYRSSAIRRLFLAEERYAGRYLQALWQDNDPRYSILDVYFNRRRKRYEVEGRTYDGGGNLLASFRSGHVIFPAPQEANIEFVWEGSRNSSGYTRMSVHSAEGDFLEGEGFVITFDVHPKVYPFQFKLLREDYVLGDLGRPAPRDVSDEPDFVRTFHARFGPLIRSKFAAPAQEAA